MDVEKVQRILLNLLSNAFKFTPPGGAVVLCLRGGDERAALAVRDSGPGVGESLREVIFERFRQGEGGADRRFGGTGLGLAIVKEFVGLHGGSVAVQEAPEGGAQFTVTLPLAAPAGTQLSTIPSVLDEQIGRQALDELHLRQEKKAEATAPVRRSSGGVVLVVEDNPDMNAFLAEALGRHHHVVTALDGQEGLEKAVEVQPDVIVSDLMMPRLSGEKLVEALLQREQVRDVPIVVLTARGDEEVRLNLLRLGVRHYLTKPFSEAELLACVDGLISRRRQRLAELCRFNAELAQRVVELERETAERRQAEAGLRDREARLRAILDTAADAIITIDREGTIQSVNPATERLFGYTTAEMVGHNVNLLMPSPFREEHDGYLRRYHETGREHIIGTRKWLAGARTARRFQRAWPSAGCPS